MSIAIDRKQKRPLHNSNRAICATLIKTATTIAPTTAKLFTKDSRKVAVVMKYLRWVNDGAQISGFVWKPSRFVIIGR